MLFYQNGNGWLIEHQLNLNFVEEIKQNVNQNLNILPKFQSTGYSTTGDSDQYWLSFQNKNKEFASKSFFDFAVKYKNEILGRLRSCQILESHNIHNQKNNINLEYFNGWTVIGRENSYHKIHKHNLGSFDGISTVLYLNVPETNNVNFPENNIYLVTNLNQKNPFYFQNILYILEIIINCMVLLERSCLHLSGCIGIA
jgi:hypothetical protein